MFLGKVSNSKMACSSKVSVHQVPSFDMSRFGHRKVDVIKSGIVKLILMRDTILTTFGVTLVTLVFFQKDATRVTSHNQISFIFVHSQRIYRGASQIA